MPPMSEQAPLNRPRSKTDLFISFTLLALQGFGGVLAVVQRVLVEEKRWMTREQFIEDWAVAQIMPGPNVVNLSLMIGGRYFGLAGALAGLAGFLWAAQTGFVNPELMGFHMSAHAIMMVILGGMGNVAGAIIGAFSFEYLLHLFKDLPAIGNFNTGKHWQMWMGLFIVALVIFAPKGILGLLARAFAKKEANNE